MYWEEYLEDVLRNNKLDGIQIEIEHEKIDLPKIVKVSTFLLEKMISHQGANNIFVFPDCKQIPFLFTLSKVMFDIESGKVENKYSPETFQRGQILKIGSCITRFIEIGESRQIPGKKLIYLEFADLLRHGCPLELAPYFQISDTKKKLSKYGSYVKERKKIEQEFSEGNSLIPKLKAVKTHLSSSIVYVSTVSDSERKADEIRINGESIYDPLLIAKTDYLGELVYYKGKYVGVPALIFSSQVSYVNELIEKGHNIQSVIINLNECDIESQLDYLDELIQKKIPVLCIVDTVNSIELQELDNRKFNIWRWDKDSLNKTVFSDSTISSEKKLRKCKTSEVFYHTVSDCEISSTFSCVYQFNRIIKDESAQINNVYSKLINLAYSMVRNVCEVEEYEKSLINNILNKCNKIVEEERSFIDERVYLDFKKAIDSFSKIYNENSFFPKSKELYNLLINRRYDKFYIICSNHDDPNGLREYWEKRLARIGYRPTIYVVYPKIFLELDDTCADVAILTGWFNQRIIKRILYSYKVRYIHIFTYGCEEKWRKAHTKYWTQKLNNHTNNVIANKSFSSDISSLTFGDKNPAEAFTESDEEIIKHQDDLDLILQESKYYQYTARGSDDIQIVNAKPVGFVGGEFALYTEGHRILVATPIIYQTGSQIEKKEVEKLKVGDFIVIRETDKDIIREVAEKILEANGKLEYKRTAALWKDALLFEAVLNDIDDIYKKLVKEGCTRSLITVRNWIQSEDIIIPQDPEDLKYIAAVTGDSVLTEKMDEIVTAGNYIKNAHIKAGRILSERLTKSIATKLNQDGSIDPYNIWDPIEIELEEVGNVKVLKIIDIGNDYISVDAGNTNRVLAEKREDLLWLG